VSADFVNFAHLKQPPSVLKASGNLSERELMETEVISMSNHIVVLL
jgi:hypothetical protein